MSNYFVVEGDAEGSIVLLPSIPKPGRGDGWMFGRKFVNRIDEPIELVAIEDFDRGTLMSFYSSPPLMHRDLYEAISSSGVDNIEVFDAVIRKADGTVLSTSHKAFNVIGVVGAADLAKTKFSDLNPSRMVDASIESLEIDADRARELLVFRLAEYVGAVVVHEKVRQAVEARGITNIKFTAPPDFLS